ncbi:hypothetical protein K0M31_004898 [Melipona bicolor]|uniref:Uncharacterized protein n=1 Tax=Melipona bicolor TaxID=60889 RepID=A0AA40FVQ5_9HYME|nr:hypothetical protein K0M31_004898 [Melipona bicolor]
MKMQEEYLRQFAPPDSESSAQIEGRSSDRQRRVFASADLTRTNHQPTAIVSASNGARHSLGSLAPLHLAIRHRVQRSGFLHSNGSPMEKRPRRFARETGKREPMHEQIDRLNRLSVHLVCC